MTDEVSRSSGRFAGRDRPSRVLPVVGIVVGMLLLALPIALDLWGALGADRTITTASDSVEGMQDEERKRWLAQARAYNHVLAGERTDIPIPDILPYQEQLGGSDGSVVSWIFVPKAGIRMPVRLGTSDSVLAAGAGHLEGTSLPVGGKSTHAVVMGHSGMYGSRMFDDIRELGIGDLFVLNTMGEKLSYEVEDVRVVLPEELGTLKVERGRDLCTLVTCTPYGVNDHRLLVTGRRTSRMPAEESPAQEVAGYVGRPRVAPLVMGMVLLLCLALVRRVRRRRQKGRRNLGGTAAPNARDGSGNPPARRRP